VTRRRNLPTRAGGSGDRARHHDRPGDGLHGTSGTLVEELRRTERALQEQRDLAETLLRAQSELGEGVLVVDEARIAYANEAAGRLLGYAPEELAELDSYLELVAPEQRTSVDDRLRGPGRTSEAVLETVLLRRDGARLPAEVCAKYVNGGARFVALVRDLSLKRATERHRLELTREQAARAAVEAEKERWALLASVGERLTASLDFDTRLHEVARALVPGLADWCAVQLLTPDGDVELVALEHVDPKRARHALEAAPNLRFGPQEVDGLDHVLKSGEPQLRTRRALRRLPVATTGGIFDLLLEPGLGSYLLVPLAARGRTYGTLLLAMSESGRRQDANDLAFANEVGRRVGLSLDNARLHAESRDARSTAEDALRERDATLQNLRKNLSLVQSIVEGTSDLVFIKDLEGRYVLVNSSFVRAFQRPLAEILGRDDAALLPPDAAAAMKDHDRSVQESGQPHTFEETAPLAGTERTLFVMKAPYRDAEGRLIGLVGIARDITGRKEDERRLAFHAAQQEAVAEIGGATLAGAPLSELLDRCVRLVASTMRVEFAHVFEATDDGRRMLLRAGLGWEPGLVGEATVGAGAESHAGYTLTTNAPVIVEDLARERRFRPSSLLLRHGATGGVMVPIHAEGRPFGVLGAHARGPRRFTTEDVLFLQAVAHVLATAIERRRMEQVLRASEERLRTVVTGAPIALFALDPEGRFTLSEGHGLKHLGLMPEHVLGRPVAEAAGVPQLAEQAQRALRGETVTGLVESNGHAFETRLAPARTPEGALAGAVGVATDVTERRRAEVRREAQYAASHLLSEADSIDQVGPELLRMVGDRLGWEVAALWLGTKEDDTLSCVATWQSTPEPPDGLLSASRVRRVKRGEGVVGIVWSTGRPVWIRDAARERAFRRTGPAARDGLHALVALPIVSPRDVLGVVEFFAHDVRETDEDLLRLLSSLAAQVGLFLERRRAMLEVRRLNAELETRVGQRTRELEAANRELEAFSYSVSHDLRAPLRTIDGFGKALLEDYAGVLDEEGRHLLARVRAGTQRMAQLIDDLLKLSRITRSDLQRVPVDLSALVEGAVAAWRQQDPARQVETVVRPGLVVEGDPALLRVAVDNLVGNAWKFTRQRDVARIEFGADVRDGETVYYVRDNGAGFDMSYTNKLFVPFQRLHRAAEFEGSGIGLATVHRIVQRHGGRIWADGRVGEGAAFFFTVPAR
jgi:PAS domain S-box-containing protein